VCFRSNDVFLELPHTNGLSYQLSVE